MDASGDNEARGAAGVEGRERGTGLGPGPGLGRREILVAALAFLLAAAWPMRAALLDPNRVLLGVDTASTALPWSVLVAADPAAESAVRPRNPGLSDQALVFYPGHKWISRSWRGGDPPLWNPLIYAGVPAAGNPQLGVFDPQVLLVALAEALFGERGFHWGTTALAWLRLGLAGLGAWLLARRLGLSRPAAALTGAAFAFSGFQVLWLGHSLGHVAPFLPWVLYCLEGTRGPRPLRAAALAGLALWGAILGGHPETAFYVGAAAGLWALALLRDNRRAGLLGLGGLALGALASAFVLLPFLEYLKLSGAQAIRAQQLEAGGPGGLGGVDLVSLGVLLLAGAFVLVFRAAVTGATAEPLAGERRPGPTAAAGVWSAGLGLAFALVGTALVLASRGLADTAALALVHDLHGAPGQNPGGYLGRGTYLEEASAWIAPLALGLALAALFTPRGPLRRRGLVALLGLGAWLLVLQAPGLLELYRFLPVVGLGATVRLAAVSSLMLALLAGEALDAAPRTSRATAALVLLLILAGVTRPEPPPVRPAVPVAPDTSEEVGFVRRPAAELPPGDIPLEGWIHPELAVEHVRVEVVRLDARGAPVGEPLGVPADLLGGPSREARDEAPGLVAAAPEGARFFRTNYMSGLFLPGEGAWRFTVEFYAGATDTTPVGARVAAVSILDRPPSVAWPTLVLTGLGLVALLGLGPGAGAWALAALVLFQGLWFARGQNPSAPASEAFPLTATEALLERDLGFHRFFSGPRALPPSTGMVRGLRDLNGYDGLDVQRYNDYRILTQYKGGRVASALLGWHARGAPLDTPLFRLFGVSHLVCGEPLDLVRDAPGWELVAAPDGSAPESAECWIYRDPAPLPRAFIATRSAGPSEVDARYATWDPLVEAILTEPWTPARPATRADAELVELSNNRAVVRAELDGDGLLVLTEQAFPGWVAEVDGEERPILTADAIFRAVPLSAGQHEVVFRYRPRSLAVGFALGLTALVGLILGAAWRARGARPANRV